MKSKQEKVNEARKNAEAQKAMKKQARLAKASSTPVVQAVKGKKPASLVKQSAKKKK